MQETQENKEKEISKIIISIPAYNEEKTLPGVLKEIKQVMDEWITDSYSYQILVVNDGSVDGTARVVREAGANLISLKRNSGLAVVFRTEMKYCQKLGADIIVHTDADGQYPAKFIPKLIEKLEEGNDLVIGSRFDDKGGEYSGSFMKSLGNRAFAKVFSGLLKSKITDTTTGFRAFTKEVAQLPLINRFTYTQEQLIRAGKEGMKVAEISITTNKTRPSRLMKGSFDYAIKAWINIFRIYRDYNPLRFFGRIGFLFILVGIALGIWIVYTQIMTGSVGGVPRVVLSALFLITGIQIILFGLLADMNKK